MDVETRQLLASTQVGLLHDAAVPAERVYPFVETLLGDPSKAKEKLGWTPKTTFEELVAEMVREDLKSAERDELVKRHGYAAYDYNE